MDETSGLRRFTCSWFQAVTTVPFFMKIFEIGPQNLALDTKAVTEFQVWRLLTAALYYPWGPHLLYNCALLLVFSKRLEEGPHYRRFPADYCFLLIVTWLGCTLLSLVFDVQLLMEPMVHSVMYIWCLLNPDELVFSWLGVEFKAKHLPLAFCAFHLYAFDLQLKALLPPVIGIIVGEFYHFFRFVFHRKYGGIPFLLPPKFLITWVDKGHQHG